MNTPTLATQFTQRRRFWDGLSGRIRPMFTRIGTWLRVGAGYHAAAGTFEELSRLSDAELKRRGLSRDTLGQHVCKSAEQRASQ